MEFKEKKAIIKSYLNTHYGKLDSGLYELLKSTVEYQDDFLFNPIAKRLLNGTKFSNTKKEELVKLFERENFNKLSKNDYKHLFQEIYNREITSKKYHKRYICKVDNDFFAPSQLASVNQATNKMNVNTDFIYHSIKRDEKLHPERVNSKNIGPVCLLVTLHETNHNAQFESLSEFLCNKNLTKEEKSKIALFFIENSLLVNAYARRKPELIGFINSSYRYSYCEHNANYEAVKTCENEYNNTNSEEFQQSLAFFALDSLKNNQNTSFKEISEKDYIKNRLNNMEDVMNKYLDYFDKVTINCELKNEILELAKDYLKKDENNISDFARDLYKELKSMQSHSKNLHKSNYIDVKI